MSAFAKNCVYRVNISKEEKKPEPTISRKEIEQYKKDIEKYLVVKK